MALFPAVSILGGRLFGLDDQPGSFNFGGGNLGNGQDHIVNLQRRVRSGYFTSVMHDQSP